MAWRHHYILFALCVALISILLSLSKGSMSISWDQLLFHSNTLFSSVFFEIRLPRTLTAFTAGGLLALAGSLMQLLLQNPLADPYVLGVSGGAACVTLLLMMLGFSDYGLVVGAWSGSLLVTLLIILLARRHQWQHHTLLLTGVALSCGFSAGISLILLLSHQSQLHSMLFWLTGDLSHTTMPWIGMLVLSVGLVITLLITPGLSLLARGDLPAQLLGLDTKRYRCLIYLLSTLFTATAVTLVGCIGFIGLIIPHLTRLLVGFDYRLRLPISVLFGGSLLVFADTLARTAFAPQQIPVGIIMALIGVPIFIGLLQR